jgi:hypothetical protein
MLVASSAPVDQFMVQNPEYFFGRSPEHAYVNPDNLQILLNHLKCAAFELPLRGDEAFGSLDLVRLCEHLEEVGFLHHSADGWHWISESYPADGISLRAVRSPVAPKITITHGPLGGGPGGAPCAVSSCVANSFSNCGMSVVLRSIYHWVSVPSTRCGRRTSGAWR